MRNLYLPFLFILFSQPCHSDVVGEWTLDVEKTIKFNKEKGVVTSLWKSLFVCLSENSTLTINNDHYISTAKDHACSYNNKAADIKGYNINCPYRIAFDSPDVTALVINNEEGFEFLEVIHKIDDDHIWIYYSGEPEGNESHIRNYYKRKK